MKPLSARRFDLADKAKWPEVILFQRRKDDKGAFDETRYGGEFQAEDIMTFIR